MFAYTLLIYGFFHLFDLWLIYYWDMILEEKSKKLYVDV